jgi:PAS domain-containing protein
MHYTGMAAARLDSTGTSDIGGALVDRISLGVAVGGVTFLILGMALVGAMLDRRFSRQAGELAETEALYSSLFEQSVDALLVHDTGGRIVDCNSEACRALGYTRDELLCMSIDDIATNLVVDENGARRAGPLAAGHADRARTSGGDSRRGTPSKGRHALSGCGAPRPRGLPRRAHDPSRRPGPSRAANEPRGATGPWWIRRRMRSSP